MFGSILVRLAFAASLFSVVAYFLNFKRGDGRLLRPARVSYLLTFSLVVGIAAYFLSLILTHQFQYTYIWSYSSRELSLPLLISTFYAGQEGSFMLWTFFSMLIGVLLMRYTARKEDESALMSIYGLVNAALLLMLIVKNPFLRVWESWPGKIAVDYIPADGRGLNPLLQNYWMVIHPQVLFAGFSAMTVPYAQALAALLKRDYRRWIYAATPWLVGGALVLGTGIIMGGFWAYETLGWGGYWGWDPVENSSLVPWLIAIAGIHMFMAQKRTGGYVRTNLVLAMLCFVFVVYSTFLTRSGVLGDTSVHSFVDPGMTVYWLLVGAIVLFAGLAVVMLIKRWKEIPHLVVAQGFYSREFTLSLGALLLVCAALVITAGTSSPLITALLRGTKSAVDPSYYATTTVPLGIAIGVLSGVGQLLWWSRTRKEEFLRSLRFPLATAAAAALALSFTGGVDPLMGLFLFGAAFALIANVQVGLRVLRANPRNAGGAVAHVGMAVMFFGFVASSHGDSQQTVALVQGEPKQAMGYTLTYAGYHPVGNEKYAFLIDVEKEGKKYRVAPVMYYSQYNEGVMRNPDILNLITKDFYLAPVSLGKAGQEGAEGADAVTLRRGEAKNVGPLEVRFVDFVVPDMSAMMDGKEMKIGAILKVRSGDGAAQTVTPMRIIRGSMAEDVPVKVDGRYEVVIAGMRPNTEDKDASTVDIAVRDLGKSPVEQRDVLIAEASVKPFINLVWSGVIVMLVGFVVTIVRRVREAATKSSERRLSQPTAVPNL